MGTQIWPCKKIIKLLWKRKLQLIFWVFNFILSLRGYHSRIRKSLTVFPMVWSLPLKQRINCFGTVGYVFLQPLFASVMLMGSHYGEWRRTIPCPQSPGVLFQRDVLKKIAIYDCCVIPLANTLPVPPVWITL